MNPASQVSPGHVTSFGKQPPTEAEVNANLSTWPEDKGKGVI